MFSDARVSNLVWLTRKLCWIDLRAGNTDPTSFNFKMDLRLLIRSVYGEFDLAGRNSITDLLDSYVKLMSDEGKSSSAVREKICTTCEEYKDFKKK